MRRLICIIVLFELFISVDLLAAENSENNLVLQAITKNITGVSHGIEPENKGNSFFDLKLFSLSKNVEGAFDAPAAVYIITSEDIRRSGSLTIMEALRMVPGLEVAKQGAHKWAVGARGSNFQFTNKLLVLVDGRSLYTPLFGGTFWEVQDYLVDDIEKIEVIRGPGGTIWGSNAVNGIVNIITKGAEKTQGTYASSVYSSKNDAIFESRYGNKIGKNFFYRLYAKSVKKNGDHFLNKENAYDGYYSKQAGFSVKSISPEDTFTLQGDLRINRANNFFSLVPALEAPFTALESHRKKASGGNIVAKLNHKYSKNSKLNVQLYFDFDHFNGDIEEVDNYTYDFDMQHIVDFDDSDQMVWGINHRSIVSSITPDDIFISSIKNDRYDKLYGGFIQYKKMILDDELYITVGSKLEHNPFTGFEYQPSIRTTFFPSDEETLWAAFTRAVRTPNQAEADSTIRLAGTPSGYVATLCAEDSECVGYKSERLNSYEAGYRVKLRDNFLFEVTVFFSDYDRLRTQEVGVLTPFDDIAVPIVLANSGFGETYGVEFNAKYQVNSIWKVQGSYSILKNNYHLNAGSTDRGLEGTEKMSPRHQLKIQSFMDITPELEWDNILSFRSELIESNGNRLKSCILLNTKVSWRPLSDFEVSFIGKDLLNAGHQEFSPALYSNPIESSRTFFFKATVEF